MLKNKIKRVADILDTYKTIILIIVILSDKFAVE